MIFILGRPFRHRRSSHRFIGPIQQLPWYEEHGPPLVLLAFLVFMVLISLCSPRPERPMQQPAETTKDGGSDAALQNSR